jgi:hypothetical protein
MAKRKSKKQIEDEKEILYVKIDGKYKAYGKFYSIDHLPFGTYFVENKSTSKGFKTIKTWPDFYGLESAIYSLRDTICELLYKDQQEWFKGKLSGYEFSTLITESIRLKIIEQQKETIKILNKD